MKIAVLGTGNMGMALLKGVLRQMGSSASVIAFDKVEAALSDLPKGVRAVRPELWAREKPDVVVVAVKPPDVASTLEPLAGVRGLDPLWLSLAAGVSIHALEASLGAKARVCRVMPNTPALIGQGISAYSLNKQCTGSDAERAEDVLSACGKVVAVPEKLMNAVTGLSGSGPAYVYLFIEALIEGGVTAGLPLDVARQCAVQTVIGAAMMADQSSESVSDLKRRVMSPGGTTVRGLMALEENKFKYAVARAVTDATARADELGRAADSARMHTPTSRNPHLSTRRKKP
jgi:pyrroline-5-carboxylate reductase